MSIIMGLLLLLVCVTAGAAALTSAMSNAGRYSHLRQDQQRYLAVASAARLVRSELCKGEYTASVSLTETYTRHKHGPNENGEVSWTTTGPVYKMGSLVSKPPKGEFSGWFKDHMDKVGWSEVPSAEWWFLDPSQSKPDRPVPKKYENLTVQVDGKDSQVKWTLEMEDDYDLCATFWAEEDGNRYYTTTLVIPARTNFKESFDAPSDLKTITTRTLTVTWPLNGAVIRQN